MIYGIYIYDEKDDYKSVGLDAAITDYYGEAWRVIITLDKSEMTQDTLWLVSAGGRSTFEMIARDKVPRWFRALADKMKPRIVAEYFQTFIDAHEAVQEKKAEERQEQACAALTEHLEHVHPQIETSDIA